MAEEKLAEKRERDDISLKIINLVEDTKGREGCGHEHGLSFYLETKKHKLLMDTGATGLFLENAQALGVDVTQVDTVILSHGHYDHSGGLLSFAKVNPKAQIYMRDTAGEAYYHVTDTLEKYIGIDKEILSLPQLVMVKGEKRLDEELSLFGGITGRKYPAKSNLQLKKKEGNVFVQDTFGHEQCLAIEQEGKRILLSGCAHNGILNILDRYREIYGGMPDMVISGFHMMKKGEYTEEETETIVSTARELKQTGALFYSGHCTGQTAFALMKEIMGEQLRAIHSGESIS